MKIGKIFTKKKQEEEMAKPKKFEVIEGGKSPKTGGKEPPSDDWLTPLGDNTVFLARQKRTSEPMLSEFQIIKHSENAVQMKIGDQMLWFDPGRFCASTDLVDILHYGTREE